MFNFRDLSRVTKTFRLEIGPLKARGVPAILLGSAAIVASAGFARLLVQNPAVLSETIREATRFVGVLRGDTPRQLNPIDD
jgi:hypothetical protein